MIKIVYAKTPEEAGINGANVITELLKRKPDAVLGLATGSTPVGTYKELIAKGEDVKYEDVLREMIERDNNDRSRDVAPAVPADDAVMLDNSDMSVEENVDAVIEIIKSKGIQI